jgi:phage N-6-adenine-methyltransferase
MTTDSAIPETQAQPQDAVGWSDWLSEEVAPNQRERSEPSVMFSTGNVEWPTPQWFFDALNKEFGFTLDVASTHENAKCKRHFTREDNGLLKSWANETVWMNPPYGEGLIDWMRKAHDAAVNDNATVVCLVPARTGTEWWHRYAMKHEVRLLRGRLNFGDATANAPFSSAIIVMRPRTFRLLSGAEAPATSSDNDVI